MQRKLTLLFLCLFITTAKAEIASSSDFIVISKAAHRLVLYHDGQIVRRYEIDLGWQPRGAKIRAGDGRTPEGIYRILRHNPDSHYHLSLALSYPQASDIGQAILRKVDPGSAIMIHGHPNGRNSFRSGDWTDGCVALTNENVEDLYGLVADNMKVIIQP